MIETESGSAVPPDDEQARPPQKSNRRYILLAAILVVVIVVVLVLLVAFGYPLLRQGEPTAIVDAEPALVPTFTPGPTKEPTNTPPPSPTPTAQVPVMLDTDDPAYGFVSAGARPSNEWTGFFGEVQDAQGNPREGVFVIVWYRDGTPASDAVSTDAAGLYEIRLAEAPLAGMWSIQLLAEDGSPVSKLYSFNTDEDTEAGVQNIQVIWQELQ
jgi:hypothetical protein